MLSRSGEEPKRRFPPPAPGPGGGRGLVPFIGPARWLFPGDGPFLRKSLPTEGVDHALTWKTAPGPSEPAPGQAPPLLAGRSGAGPEEGHFAFTLMGRRDRGVVPEDQGLEHLLPCRERGAGEGSQGRTAERGGGKARGGAAARRAGMPGFLALRRQRQRPPWGPGPKSAGGGYPLGEAGESGERAIRDAQGREDRKAGGAVRRGVPERPRPPA